MASTFTPSEDISSRYKTASFSKVEMTDWEATSINEKLVTAYGSAITVVSEDVLVIVEVLVVVEVRVDVEVRVVVEVLVPVVIVEVVVAVVPSTTVNWIVRGSPDSPVAAAALQPVAVSS